MVQVIAKKLDGKSLTLENPENGETLTWPLDQILEPLEIGDKITLMLSSAVQEPSASSPRIQNKADEQTDERRKLLEQLVN